MIVLSGSLICANQTEAALVRSLLPLHIELTLAEPGCLVFEVKETDVPLVWSVFEQFSDRASFDAHQARVRASKWGQESAHIKRDYKIVEMR